MEEFTEISYNVVEFPSTWKTDRLQKIGNIAVQTDALPIPKNQSVQSYEKKDGNTQTEANYSSKVSIDEHKLALWLRKVYPIIEAELTEGITQVYDFGSHTSETDLDIRPYQKIPAESSNAILTQGAVTWLSVRTNNAPILVIASSPIHNEWCEHIQQSLMVYIPKRMQSQEYVAYNEMRKVPIKACIKSLSTNPFNKDIFSGGTVIGDLYLWQYESDNTGGDIKELCCESTQHGSVVCMDWLQVHDLLTCHLDGIVCLWKVSKEIIKDKSFRISNGYGSEKSLSGISAILAISISEFVIGTEDGKLLLCSISNLIPSRDEENFFDPIISDLESHNFNVTTLLKTNLNGVDVMVSCDLSGEVYFHDLGSPEDGPTLIVKMPLPFKNSIACSKNAEYIFCPSTDGSLDIFKTKDGSRALIDGNMNGRGNVIRISENGAWIVIGCYDGIFQIFSVQEK